MIYSLQILLSNAFSDSMCGKGEWYTFYCCCTDTTVPDCSDYHVRNSQATSPHTTFSTDQSANLGGEWLETCHISKLILLLSLELLGWKAVKQHRLVLHQHGPGQQPLGQERHPHCCQCCHRAYCQDEVCVGTTTTKKTTKKGDDNNNPSKGGFIRHGSRATTKTRQRHQKQDQLSSDNWATTSVQLQAHVRFHLITSAIIIISMQQAQHRDDIRSRSRNRSRPRGQQQQQHAPSGPKGAHRGSQQQRHQEMGSPTARQQQHQQWQCYYQQLQQR